MDINSIPQKKVHHGRNVRYFREMREMKQDVLASALGIAQQTVSILEKKEKIDDETLRKIAEAMDIPMEAIKNFDEEKAINIVSNTFQDGVSVNGVGPIVHYEPTFNPLDKVVELYDQIIKGKNDEITYLKQLLKDKK